MQTTSTRRNAARESLDHYSADYDANFRESPPAGQERIIADLIAELLHIADAEDLNAARILDTAPHQWKRDRRR